MECCPSGEQVLGICQCCPECAKAEYESCGGLWGSDGTCATGFFCKGVIDEQYGGYPRDGICTKIKHHGQYQTKSERSDNPEWHKRVPTCNTPTYADATDKVTGCSCNGDTLWDSDYKNYKGECLTRGSRQEGSKYWCYIDEDSSCNDKTYSSNSGKYWSYEAC